jgi:hypothetical protein
MSRCSNHSLSLEIADNTECPDGEQCFTATYCKYDMEDVPLSSPPIQSSSFTSSPSLQSWGAPSAPTDYIVGVVNPTQQPSFIGANATAGQEDEEDWSQNTVDEGGEDWTAVAVDSSQNLWCGTTQFDAIRNCGVGTRCDNGICPEGLKCFVVSSVCGGGDTDVATASTVAGFANSTEDVEDWSGLIVTGTSTPTVASPTTPDGNSSSSTLQPVNDTENGNWSDSTDFGNSSVLVTEQPISDAQPGIVDTFFCGFSLDDASTSCHKRCRSGSPGECPSGESCFGYTTCIAENPRTPPTKEPTTSTPSSPNSLGVTKGLCAVDYIGLQQTCWYAVECNNTHPCTENQTCFENIDCSLTTGLDIVALNISQSPSITPPSLAGPDVTNVSLGSSQNQSAAPISIETSLMPSQAPVLMNTPSNAKPVDESLSPSNEPQLFCASSMDELEASCATALSCNSGPCPSGTFCFPFDCNVALVEEPAVSISTEQPATSSDGKTFYCANNTAELEESCGMLPLCNNGLSSCPEDQTCLEYSCQQSIDLCPLNYVGWQSSRDCLEYYECTNGVAGPSSFCSDGLKFDKLRGECRADSTINENCYGSPLPPAKKPTTRPSGPPINLCPKGFDGWYSSVDCKEYYKCDNGSAGAILVCDEGLSFDKVRNKCTSSADVSEYCYGPPLETNGENGNKQSTSENSKGSCLEGYTGWEG